MFRYDGSVVNSVKSKEKGIYVSSYRFLGSTELKCNDFYENYSNENIWDNWKLVDQESEFPGKWSYVVAPTKVGLT